MARFRAPTLSPAGSLAGHRSSSRQNRTPLARASSQLRVEHARAIQKGKEVEVKRTTYRSFHFRYIYVGNLQPNITEAQLATFFGRAGGVTCVSIRSASGSVVTGVQASQKDTRLYATVEFRSSFDASRALRLHKKDLNGSPVFITQDILNLPEFQEIQRQCEGKTERMDPVVTALATFHSKWRALKRITVERTEIIPLDYAAGGTSKGQYQQLLQPGPRKVMLMGVSLANTIS